MDRLLMINDLINGVIERFEACQKGDWSKGRVDISCVSFFALRARLFPPKRTNS
jgi:hypothetical protein